MADAATVVEVVGRQFSKGQNPAGRLSFQVRGAAEESLAYNLVNAMAPAVHKGLLKQNVRVNEVGGGVWSGEVRYGVRGTGEQPTWSFDFGSTNVHIDCGLEHIADFPVPGGKTPNYKGMINVKDDGSGKKAEGTDVEAGIFTWEETHAVPYVLFQSPAYLQILNATAYHCNHAPWRIWGKGEVYFRGATGSSRGEEPVPLTYRFATSPTLTGVTILGIPGITKEGFHCLWFESQLKDDGASSLVDRPIAAHVERVHYYADFTRLGLINDPWNP